MSVFSLPSGGANHFQDHAFKRSVLVSMILHAIVIAVAGGMTLFHATGTVYAPTYTVDLISLSSSPGAPGKGEGGAPGPSGPPGPELKPAPKAAPEPAPKPAPKSAPKPEAPAVSPTKKTAAPAVEPAKESAPPPPPAVSKEIKPAGGDEAAAMRLERKQRIEELEQEARRLYESFTAQNGEPGETPGSPADSGAGEKTGAVGTGSGGTGTGGTGTGGTGTGGTGTGTGTGGVGGITGSGFGGGGGQPVDIRYRTYFDLIWSRIRSSWILPEGVATRDRLLTVVGIRIAPDGEILEFRIEKGSGNAYYDQSAIRAIRKSSPLPPLPEDLGDEPLEIGVNFRYPE